MAFLALLLNTLTLKRRIWADECDPGKCWSLPSQNRVVYETGISRRLDDHELAQSVIAISALQVLNTALICSE